MEAFLQQELPPAPPAVMVTKEVMIAVVAVTVAAVTVAVALPAHLMMRPTAATMTVMVTTEVMFVSQNLPLKIKTESRLI
jgi:hypothetical protein